MELYRLSFEQEGTDTARREYREVLRQLGDLLMKEGYAKRAKRYYRMADQLLLSLYYYQALSLISLMNHLI